MLIAGVCNCGPDAFVSGSIAAELGERENAQSAVSGFVNGKNSIGITVVKEYCMIVNALMNLLNYPRFVTNLSSPRMRCTARWMNTKI